MKLRVTGPISGDELYVYPHLESRLVLVNGTGRGSCNEYFATVIHLRWLIEACLCGNWFHWDQIGNVILLTP